MVAVVADVVVDVVAAVVVVVDVEAVAAIESSSGILTKSTDTSLVDFPSYPLPTQ